MASGTAEALSLLAAGELNVEGRLVDASNATLFCTVTLGTDSASCVYKPVRGERPLWDFPDGTLAGREVSAYLLSEAGGWGVVPPTVMRDGPYGEGMCQLWIDPDESVDVVALVQSADPVLRSMAVFDAVSNNADRKGGHLLPVSAEQVYGVDHGLCFHEENKLRTLLWAWRGSRFDAAETEQLTLIRDAVAGELGDHLRAHLTDSELAALAHRIERLLSTGRFPSPRQDRPAVPWPPF